MKPLHLTPQGKPFPGKELTTSGPADKAGRSTPDSGAGSLRRSVHNISNDTSGVRGDRELRALFAIIRRDPDLKLADAIRQVKRFGEKAVGSEDINTVRDLKGRFRTLSPDSARRRAGSGGAISGTATDVRPSGKEGDSRIFRAVPATIEPETSSTPVHDTTPDLPPQEKMSAEDKVLEFPDKSLEAHDDVHDKDATSDPTGRQIWGLTDTDPISAEEVEQDVLGMIASDSDDHQIPEGPGDSGADSSDESDDPTSALVAHLIQKPPSQKTTTSIFGDADDESSSVSSDDESSSVSSEASLLSELEDSDDKSVQQKKAATAEPVAMDARLSCTPGPDNGSLEAAINYMASLYPKDKIATIYNLSCPAEYKDDETKKGLWETLHKSYEFALGAVLFHSPEEPIPRSHAVLQQELNHALLDFLAKVKPDSLSTFFSQDQLTQGAGTENNPLQFTPKMVDPSEFLKVLSGIMGLDKPGMPGVIVLADGRSRLGFRLRWHSGGNQNDSHRPRWNIAPDLQGFQLPTPRTSTGVFDAAFEQDPAQAREKSLPPWECILFGPAPDANGVYIPFRDTDELQAAKQVGQNVKMTAQPPPSVDSLSMKHEGIIAYHPEQKHYVTLRPVDESLWCVSDSRSSEGARIRPFPELIESMKTEGYYPTRFLTLLSPHRE